MWLVVSLGLCLTSGAGASLVQTNGGTVEITDMRWVTPSGKTMSALLFRPEGATADAPVPAVVTSHGWFNSREMQDGNFVELSRRGYVVLAIDMYGHGGSDPVTNGQEDVGATGMYDAVRLVADLPYVDTTEIGITGHSNGARAANFAVELDDAAATQLISAVFLISNEPVYGTDAGSYSNVYGTRDVGVVADQYDEFFFRSYDSDGDVLTVPRDYIRTPNAQSFLHFGAAVPENDVREPGIVYTDDDTGAMRVIHTPAQEHTWAPVSSAVIGETVEFFDMALGAPNPIGGSSQLWQVKVAFNALGLLGFGMFLVALPRLLLLTRPFAGLREAPSPAPAAFARVETVWFWAGLGVTALVSAASYFIFNLLAAGQTETGGGSATVTPLLLQQPASFVIGAWAAFNGVVAVGVMVLSHRFASRRRGQQLRTLGVLPGWRSVGHGIALGVVVVLSALLLLALVDFMFTTDFRIYVVAVRALSAEKVGYFLLYLPLFLIYFTASSIAVTGFGRRSMLGREWVATAVAAMFTALGPTVLLAWQYVTFWVTGDLVPGFNGTFSIWLIPIGATLGVAVIISRMLYRMTNNPYIGGVINASIVTAMSVMTTLTVT